MHLSVAIPCLRLLPVRVEDAPALYRIYAAVRAADFQHLGWNAAQLQPLLEMQFAAQQTAYRRYADAIFYQVCWQGEAVGNLYLQPCAHHIHVMDIALVPDFQSRGLGTALMAAVMQYARSQGKGVRLRVSRHNRAMDWYGRLGFHATDAAAMDVEMQYPVDAVALGIAG